ncbi:MAG: hypothetical protein RLN60_02150 [Phycisphaerales bacterium]
MTSNIETNAHNFCDSNGIKVEYQRSPGAFPTRLNLSSIEFIDWRTKRVQHIDASTVRWTVRMNAGERKSAQLIVYEDGRPFRNPNVPRLNREKTVQTCGAMAIGAVLWHFTLMAVGLFNGVINLVESAQ